MKNHGAKFTTPARLKHTGVCEICKQPYERMVPRGIKRVVICSSYTCKQKKGRISSKKYNERKRRERDALQ
jgi:hypothetical protein